MSTRRMVADFALPDSGRYEDSGYAVYPNSILFEAGAFKDGNGLDFSMTADELSRAVEQFAPLGGNIWHKPFLQGRACEVRRIWLDDGARLRGEVAVPLGLDTLLQPHEKRLSAEFDIASKTLVGIALTSKPIVEAAALMSAASDEERDMPENVNENETSILARVLDWFMQRQPATAAPIAVEPPAPLPLPATANAAVAAASFSIEEAPEYKALLAQRQADQMRIAEFAQAAVKDCMSEATTLVDSYINDQQNQRLLPRVRADAVAALAQALADDRGLVAVFSVSATPTDPTSRVVTFSMEGSVNRAAPLKALLAGLHPTGLTGGERIGAIHALSQNPSGSPVSGQSISSLAPVSAYEDRAYGWVKEKN